MMRDVVRGAAAGMWLLLLLTGRGFGLELVWAQERGGTYTGPALPVRVQRDFGACRVLDARGNLEKHLLVCEGGCGCPDLPRLFPVDPDTCAAFGSKPFSGDICQQCGLGYRFSPDGKLVLLMPGSVRHGWCPVLRPVDLKHGRLLQAELDLARMTECLFGRGRAAVFCTVQEDPPSRADTLDVRFVRLVGSRFQVTDRWRSGSYTRYACGDMNRTGDVAFVAREERDLGIGGRVASSLLVFVRADGLVVERVLPRPPRDWGRVALSEDGQWIAFWCRIGTRNRIEVLRSITLETVGSRDLEECIASEPIRLVLGLGIGNRAELAVSVQVDAEPDDPREGVRFLYARQSGDCEEVELSGEPFFDAYVMRFFGGRYLYVAGESLNGPASSSRARVFRVD